MQIELALAHVLPAGVGRLPPGDAPNIQWLSICKMSCNVQGFISLGSSGSHLYLTLLVLFRFQGISVQLPHHARRCMIVRCLFHLISESLFVTHGIHGTTSCRAESKSSSGGFASEYRTPHEVAVALSESGCSLGVLKQNAGSGALHLMQPSR